MKYFLFPILILFISTIHYSCSSKKAENIEGAKVSFKVYGNCEMCKETIEGSLKDVAGVNYANWDVDKKIMSVIYDSTKINVPQIHKKIAGVGYDTELERGNDLAYQNLHQCCQYERKK